MNVVLLGALVELCLEQLSTRDRPIFFDQLGHQNTNASMHFFTKAYQNDEQPCQRSQNSEFQSHF